MRGFTVYHLKDDSKQVRGQFRTATYRDLCFKLLAHPLHLRAPLCLFIPFPHLLFFFLLFLSFYLFFFFSLFPPSHTAYFLSSSSLPSHLSLTPSLHRCFGSSTSRRWRTSPSYDEFSHGAGLFQRCSSSSSYAAGGRSAGSRSPFSTYALVDGGHLLDESTNESTTGRGGWNSYF